MPEKSIPEIVREAEKVIDRVLNNNIPAETCPVKKEKAKWKREKVVSELAAKLQPAKSVGPSQIKDIQN